MVSSSPCPECGAHSPCACTESAAATFTLLPALDEVFEEEERFTRLLREVKRDVVRRDFAEQAEAASSLEKKARKFDAAVGDGRMGDADRLAEDMVGSVLEFPRPPRATRFFESPRVLVTLGATLLMAAIVAILVFGRG